MTHGRQVHNAIVQLREGFFRARRLGVRTDRGSEAEPAIGSNLLGATA